MIMVSFQAALLQQKRSLPATFRIGLMCLVSFVSVNVQTQSLSESSYHTDIPEVAERLGFQRSEILDIEQPPVPQAEGLIIDATRSFRFTVSEGSQMNIDVSPDGTKIVFDLLGDLYVLPIEGGEARRITQGVAIDSDPVFSPDGQKIAFVSDRSGANNLWIVSSDGSDLRPISNNPVGTLMFFVSPDWAPDGKTLAVAAFTNDLPRELRLYDIETGKFDVALSARYGTYLGSRSVRFTSDGQHIWFSRELVKHGLSYLGNFFVPRYQIGRLELATGRIANLGERQGGGMIPTPSPDGRWLAYGSREGADTGVRLRDLVTGEDRQLLLPVDHDTQEAWDVRAMSSMAFTPDSTELIVWFDGKIWRVDVLKGDIRQIPFLAEVNFEAGPLARFVHDIEPKRHLVRYISEAAVSSRNRIAFRALQKIWIAGDDERATRASDNEGVREGNPSWSSDGMQLAFTTWDDKEGGHVYLKSMSDGSLHRLTSVPARYSTPVFVDRDSAVVLLRTPITDFHRSAAAGGTEYSNIGTSPAADVIRIELSDEQTTHIGFASSRSVLRIATSANRIFLVEGGSFVSYDTWWQDRAEHAVVLPFGRSYGFGGSESYWRESDIQSFDIDSMGRRLLVETGEFSRVFVIDLPSVTADGPVWVALSDPDKNDVNVQAIAGWGRFEARWIPNSNGASDTFSFARGRRVFQQPLDVTEEQPLHEASIVVTPYQSLSGRYC